MPKVPDNMMEQLPHYRTQYNAAKKINVYFVNAKDRDTGKRLYFYAIASQLLHEQMLSSIKQYGVIPDFAVIVEKGEGEPTSEVKAKIKAYYGFDHDAHES
jgi:hypothetical protein